MPNLIVVLGDQLTPTLPALAQAQPADTVLMVEVLAEATYVPHHPKKIAFLFSAMRHFAAELKASGLQVRYVTLTDPHNTGDFAGEILRAVAELRPSAVLLTAPGEHRVHQIFTTLQTTCTVPVQIVPDNRFFADLAFFPTWAAGKKEWRMEYFYRELRRQTGYLMTPDGKPVGGQWNYDHSNRGHYDGQTPIPQRLVSPPDAITQECLALVRQAFPTHYGDLNNWRFAVTRADAQAHLQHFITDCLPYFGQYQDAMVSDAPYLFHGLISMYLNCGLLTAKQVCDAAQAAYTAGSAPLPAVEGFIRQILGWREYVRGLYWHLMPSYATQNYLGATTPLPNWFWTGETKMNCLRQAISETLANAYAHHIQRLMVIGNFALLAGLDVPQVCNWFLAVYADAYEWVELPNVLGMALYADGGRLASKPYAASGNYLHKMSNYCDGCSYRPDEKTSARACPFNSLYWDFLHRHAATLGDNPRLKYPYATLRKMPTATLTAHQHRARVMIANIADL